MMGRVKYPNNVWDVLSNLTIADWLMVIGFSVAGGVGFWFLLGWLAGI